MFNRIDHGHVKQARLDVGKTCRIIHFAPFPEKWYRKRLFSRFRVRWEKKSIAIYYSSSERREKFVSRCGKKSRWRKKRGHIEFYPPFSWLRFEAAFRGRCVGRFCFASGDAAKKELSRMALNNIFPSGLPCRKKRKLKRRPPKKVFAANCIIETYFQSLLGVSEWVHRRRTGGPTGEARSFADRPKRTGVVRSIFVRLLQQQRKRKKDVFSVTQTRKELRRAPRC